MAENLKLPSRSYWEGFKARNEALWDKIKNNTFVNMVFPVKEVSEGNTEAILPLVVPGGNVVKQAVKPITQVEKLGISKNLRNTIFKNGANTYYRGVPYGNESKIGYWDGRSTGYPVDYMTTNKNVATMYGGRIQTYAVPADSRLLEINVSGNKYNNLQKLKIKELSDIEFNNIDEIGKYLTEHPDIPYDGLYIKNVNDLGGIQDQIILKKDIPRIFIRKRGGTMNILDYLKNGSGIHIKKANRGKFTDYCGGKVTEECIQKGKHSSNPAIRKRATFAANARKWKHQDGGCLNYLNYIQNGLG